MTEANKKAPAINEGLSQTQTYFSPTQTNKATTAGTLHTASPPLSNNTENTAPGTEVSTSIEAISNSKGEVQKKPQKNQAEVLLECAAAAELWHDNDGTGYASVPVGKHKENYPIQSRGFKDWLLQCYYAEMKRAPSSQSLKEALETVQAKARYEGTLDTPHVRVAGDFSTIWLDLGNKDWSAIKISSERWDVVPYPEVKFIRQKGTMSLQNPVTAGSEVLLSFAKFLRLDGNDQILFIATLFSTLMPRGPYPITVFKNERGCGKSTGTKAFRNVIDPRQPDVRTLPRSEQDLLIAAKGAWLLAYDNVSQIPDWLSDGLCRISTGAGGGYRTLYENDEETLFEAARPLILNGIADFVQRDDLINRCVEIAPKPIPATERKPEVEVLAKLKEFYPKVLGALLTAAVEALEYWDKIELSELPRMADFARWTCAGAPKLGFTKDKYLTAYRQNQEELEKIVLESVISQLVQAVIPFQGTATDLLAKLKARATDDERRLLPRAANTLGGKLRHIAPALRTAGIADITFPRTNDSRTIIISPIQKSIEMNRHERHQAQEGLQDKDSAGDGNVDSSRAGSNSNDDSEDPLLLSDPEPLQQRPSITDTYDDKNGSDDDLQPLSACEALEVEIF